MSSPKQALCSLKVDSRWLSKVCISGIPEAEIFGPKRRFLAFGIQFRPPNLKAEYGRIFSKWIVCILMMLNWKTFTYRVRGLKLMHFRRTFLPWLNDITIKRKLFWESWDREIWYKTCNSTFSNLTSSKVPTSYINPPYFYMYLYIWFRLRHSA